MLQNTAGVFYIVMMSFLYIASIYQNNFDSMYGTSQVQCIYFQDAHVAIQAVHMRVAVIWLHVGAMCYRPGCVLHV